MKDLSNTHKKLILDIWQKQEGDIDTQDLETKLLNETGLVYDNILIDNDDEVYPYNGYNEFNLLELTPENL